MNLVRGRSPVAFPDDPMNLDDVAQNLPTSGPVVRSLSKSCLRDPSQKYPPPPRAQVIDRAEDDISVQSTAQSIDNGVDLVEEPPLLPPEAPSQRWSATVERLPAEIMESIISHLGGQLGLAASRSSQGRDWSNILRHPRRKDITNLALVSPTFRRLVQERIFRHRKYLHSEPETNADIVQSRYKAHELLYRICGISSTNIHTCRNMYVIYKSSCRSGRPCVDQKVSALNQSLVIWTAKARYGVPYISRKRMGWSVWFSTTTRSTLTCSALQHKEQL